MFKFVQNTYETDKFTYKIPKNIYIIMTWNATNIKYTTIFNGLSAAKCNNYNDQNSRQKMYKKLDDKKV